MDLEALRLFCLSLLGVTEDVKWGNDLCFCVGGKMFCVTGFNLPMTVSLKVNEEEFDEMSSSAGMVPAPYLARHKWILVTDVTKLKKKEWERYLKQSYELVRAKLPRKIKEQLPERKKK